MDGLHNALSFAEVEARLRLMLPAQYQGRYDEVRPVSMGSAGLQYGPDGKVAWETIWQSFCDLALAGGPPHRGTLLESAGQACDEVQEEICRGLRLVTGLFAEPADAPGWVRMFCTSAGMAGWLARAIVTENVSAWSQGLSLYLPAGPGYRVEKEIKNVITATAKTCHYWLEHMQPEQHWQISDLLRAMEAESPLVLPGRVVAPAGLDFIAGRYAGWLGLRCPNVHAAVWRMRVLVVLNVLARREQDMVFVALNDDTDPASARVLRAVGRADAYARAQAIL